MGVRQDEPWFVQCVVANVIRMECVRCADVNVVAGNPHGEINMAEHQTYHLHIPPMEMFPAYRILRMLILVSKKVAATM